MSYVGRSVIYAEHDACSCSDWTGCDHQMRAAFERKLEAIDAQLKYRRMIEEEYHCVGRHGPTEWCEMCTLRWLLGEWDL